MPDQETFDELAGAERILVILRKRRQLLLERQAQQGIDTPAATLLEIEQANEAIRIQGDEIARIKTEAAQDLFSLAEAEYRQLVAFNWNTEQGRPNIQGETTLEFARLRLGLPRERATELEHEIRTKLAAEALDGIPMDIYQMADLEREEKALAIIGRAIRLNKETAIRILGNRATVRINSYFQFSEGLLNKNGVWPEESDHALFREFLTEFIRKLKDIGRIPTVHNYPDLIDQSPGDGIQSA